MPHPRGSWCVTHRPRYCRIMAAGLQAFALQVSRLLSEDRLGSFAVTTVTLLQVGVSIRRVVSEEEGLESLCGPS